MPMIERLIFKRKQSKMDSSVRGFYPSIVDCCHCTNILVRVVFRSCKCSPRKHNTWSRERCFRILGIRLVRLYGFPFMFSFIPNRLISYAQALRLVENGPAHLNIYILICSHEYKGFGYVLEFAVGFKVFG